MNITPTGNIKKNIYPIGIIRNEFQNIYFVQVVSPNLQTAVLSYLALFQCKTSNMIEANKTPNVQVCTFFFLVTVLKSSAWC